MRDVGYALAIDLGGTKIGGAIVRDDGTVVAEMACPTEAGKGGDWVLNRLKDLALEVLERSSLHPQDLIGVGLGTPGIVDAERGILLSEAVNIPGWKGRSLKAELEKVLGIPAFIDNDANTAALGELRFGAGKGVRHMVYVTVGTGVGGAIIVDGKVHRGASFSAGEVGHLPIVPDGPPCGCGGQGCLEGFISGPAIARRAREFLGRGVPLSLREISPDQITAERVAQAAKEGDALARFLLAEAGRFLGIALAGIVNLFNPERIVIGGGVAQAGEIFFAPIRWELRRRALPSAAETLQVLPATLGTRAGLLGAAALVFEGVQ